MILNYKEDFRTAMLNGFNLLGTINKVICQREQYLGNSKELDILYARSYIVSILIERLLYSDGTTPEYDRELLLCLRKMVSNKHTFCTTKKYC